MEPLNLQLYLQKTLKMFSIFKSIECLILFALTGFSLPALFDTSLYFLLFILSMILFVVNAGYLVFHLKTSISFRYERIMMIVMWISYTVVMTIILLDLRGVFKGEKAIENKNLIDNVTHHQEFINSSNFEYALENLTNKDSPSVIIKEKITHPAAIAKSNLERTKQGTKQRSKQKFYKNLDTRPDKDSVSMVYYYITVTLASCLVILQTIAWILTTSVNIQLQNLDIEAGNPDGEEIPLQSLHQSSEEPSESVVTHRSRRPSRSENSEPTEEIGDELEPSEDYDPSETAALVEHPPQGNLAVAEPSRQENGGSDDIVSSEHSRQESKGSDAVSSGQTCQKKKECDDSVSSASSRQKSKRSGGSVSSGSLQENEKRLSTCSTESNIKSGKSLQSKK